MGRNDADWKIGAMKPVRLSGRLERFISARPGLTGGALVNLMGYEIARRIRNLSIHYQLKKQVVRDDANAMLILDLIRGGIPYNFDTLVWRCIGRFEKGMLS